MGYTWDRDCSRFPGDSTPSLRTAWSALVTTSLLFAIAVVLLLFAPQEFLHQGVQPGAGAEGANKREGKRRPATPRVPRAGRAKKRRRDAGRQWRRPRPSARAGGGGPERAGASEAQAPVPRAAEAGGALARHVTPLPRPPGRGPRSPPHTARREAAPAGWDLSYLVQPDRRRKVRSSLRRGGDRKCGTGPERTGMPGEEGGKEAASGGPGPAPGSFPSPTEYPPGGEILLHAQQPLAQGLQHRRRRVSAPSGFRPLQSPRVPQSRRHTCHPRAPHTHSQPRPRLGRRPALQPLPRSRPPLARSRPAPAAPRPAQAQWAATASGCGKGAVLLAQLSKPQRPHAFF